LVGSDLDEISRCVAAGAHAVLALDKAGWHTTRKLQVPSQIPLLAPAYFHQSELGGVVMVKKAKKREWTAGDVRDLKSLAKKKTPASKIAKSL
jgi:hypothetical protein